MLLLLFLLCPSRNLAELVNFNGGRVQPQSLEPKHMLVFRVEFGGHMVSDGRQLIHEIDAFTVVQVRGGKEVAFRVSATWTGYVTHLVFLWHQEEEQSGTNNQYTLREQA